MLQTENPIRMVRELKGAPLSIILVLSIVNQRVKQEYLERSTGYTDKPVSQALQYLEEVGLADHTRAGWQLVKDNAMQLPLMMQIEESNPPEPEPADEVNPTEDISLSRNNSDLLLTYLNTNNNINNIKQVSKVNNDASRKNSDLEPGVEENLETFRHLGIKINKRTEKLARLKHVNREYILGTVKNLKQGEMLGLAIIRMEQGDELPKPKKHKAGCDCAECRHRYTEWETLEGG